MWVAEVILPLAVKSNFDYRVPPEMEVLVKRGMRVVVQFGKTKMFTGIIKSLREENDQEVTNKLKRIHELPDDQPVLHPQQLELFSWMASYYFCTEGEVMKASLPSGLKVESEVYAELLEWVDEDADLSEEEMSFLSILRNRKTLTLEDCGKILDIQHPMGRLRGMEVRGLIRLNLRMKQGYKVKTVKYLELTDLYQVEENLQSAFNSLSKSAKQEEVLMLVAEQFLKGKPIAQKEITSKLEKPESAIKALVEKGILQVLEIPVDRLANMQFKEHLGKIVLNAEQEEVLAKIKESFIHNPGKPVLLHGVTGSGKTHLYIELIKSYLEEGKQVLYLLPEISLTQQIIDRVKTAFGEIVGVYHSRFNDQERVEIWQKLLSKSYQIVIGVRSAIMMPFENLGLIIVDEEHDQSFKQNEPSPRYHARDVAVYSARTLGCQVVLGSATPSFESYHNAREGRYLLAEMHNRAVDAELPSIESVDMREQRKRKLIAGHFSKPMLDELKLVLERKEQAIFFQNRRGFTPWITCKSCGHVPRCINCDISLTYHKGRKHLRCHYCGFTELEVEKCQKCQSYEIGLQGIGTERIEEEMQMQFPEARIARMDLDTTQTRLGFLKLIRAFEAHEFDILVGTQMVSKGLDFGNVTMVGVIDADLSLNFADFRAHEHAYQLLTQVSGRAGRSTKRGKVFIQTNQPESKVLKLLQKPFATFYESEIRTRKDLLYPPFSRLIRIELRHRNQLYLEAEAVRFKNLMLSVFGESLLGPEYPYVTRLRNEYRQVALLKIARNLNPMKIREILAERIDAYYRSAPQKTLRIIVDVDPIGG